MPQGAPAGRAEPLQGLPARPEPLRHVPALRRLRPRRPQLLLPAEGEGELRRLPHAAARPRTTSARSDFDGTGRAQGPRPPLPGGQHRRWRTWSTCEHARRGRDRGAPRSSTKGEMRDRPLRPARAAAPIDGELHRAAAARGAGARARASPTWSRSSSARSSSATPSPRGRPTRNEVWVDVAVTDGGGRVDRPQRRHDEPDGEVDPWSHFVNVYMLDRDGNRIDRRNPQDIFIPLYNHQIPPGAADRSSTTALDVPPRTRRADRPSRRSCATASSTPTYMKLVYGRAKRSTIERPADRDPGQRPGGLPGRRRGRGAAPRSERSADRARVAALERLRHRPAAGRAARAAKGELRQAEEAFAQVEALGRPDGPLNLARVYLAQGTAATTGGRGARARRRLRPAGAALVGRLVHRPGQQAERLPRRGDREFRSIVDAGRRRDPRARLRLQQGLPRSSTSWARRCSSARSRSAARPGARRARTCCARRPAGSSARSRSTPRTSPAHYNLDLVYAELGDEAKAAEHFERRQTYKPDDNVARPRDRHRPRRRSGRRPRRRGDRDLRPPPAGGLRAGRRRAAAAGPGRRHARGQRPRAAADEPLLRPDAPAS